MDLRSGGDGDLAIGARNWSSYRGGKGVAYPRGLGRERSIERRANLGAGGNIASGSRLRGGNGFSTLSALAIYSTGSAGIVLVRRTGRRRGALSCIRWHRALRAGGSVRITGVRAALVCRGGRCLRDGKHCERQQGQEQQDCFTHAESSSSGHSLGSFSSERGWPELLALGGRRTAAGDRTRKSTI